MISIKATVYITSLLAGSLAFATPSDIIRVSISGQRDAGGIIQFQDNSPSLAFSSNNSPALLTNGPNDAENYSGHYTPVPEPTFYGLLAAGVMGVIWTHLRQRRAG